MSKRSVLIRNFEFAYEQRIQAVISKYFDFVI